MLRQSAAQAVIRANTRICREITDRSNPSDASLRLVRFGRLRCFKLVGLTSWHSHLGDSVQIRLCRTGMANALVIVRVRKWRRCAVVAVDVAAGVAVIGWRTSKDQRYGDWSQSAQQLRCVFHDFCPPVLKTAVGRVWLWLWQGLRFNIWRRNGFDGWTGESTHDPFEFRQRLTQ